MTLPSALLGVVFCCVSRSLWGAPTGSHGTYGGFGHARNPAGTWLASSSGSKGKTTPPVAKIQQPRTGASCAWLMNGDTAPGARRSSAAPGGTAAPRAALRALLLSLSRAAALATGRRCRQEGDGRGRRRTRARGLLSCPGLTQNNRLSSKNTSCQRAGGTARAAPRSVRDARPGRAPGPPSLRALHKVPAALGAVPASLWQGAPAAGAAWAPPGSPQTSWLRNEAT